MYSDQKPPSGNAGEQNNESAQSSAEERQPFNPFQNNSSGAYTPPPAPDDLPFTPPPAPEQNPYDAPERVEPKAYEAPPRPEPEPYRPQPAQQSQPVPQPQAPQQPPQFQQQQQPQPAPQQQQQAPQQPFQPQQGYQDAPRAYTPYTEMEGQKPEYAQAQRPYPPRPEHLNTDLDGGMGGMAQQSPQGQYQPQQSHQPQYHQQAQPQPQQPQQPPQGQGYTPYTQMQGQEVDYNYEQRPYPPRPEHYQPQQQLPQYQQQQQHSQQQPPQGQYQQQQGSPQYQQQHGGYQQGYDSNQQQYQQQQQAPQGGYGQSGTDLVRTSDELTKTADADKPKTKMRLGERLIEMGFINASQLKVALEEQRISGNMLGEAMVALGFITDDQLTLALAEMAGFELFNPKNFIIDGEALQILSKPEALKLKMLPLAIQDDLLHVAMVDPYDIVSMDTFKRKMPRAFTLKPLLTSVNVLNEAIDAAYGYASNIDDILRALEDQDFDPNDVAQLTDEEAYTHPIVRLVNALLLEAVKMGVSDLHFEPEENFIRVRYRLDGVLFAAHILHKKHWNGISQRIKIASNMNIADKLGAQDGRFSLNVGGKEADFRVSSLPTVHGENIVMRVLDKTTSVLPLDALGFSDENMAKIKRAQSKPEGIIIVTGPTGSGKSTSLYAMLNSINDVEINIQTLEDPVEYSLPMIRQTSIREGTLGFGEGIRAMLRQDPDIIFIGEVRDKITAEMALKASMTGHQVYTTLHTNDSFGAIPRLMDFDMKPGMLAGALVAVFAQRLARRLCNHCKVQYVPNAQECQALGADPNYPPQIFRAHPDGCERCKGQGYKGRTAIVEILTFDDEMNDILAAGGSKADLKQCAYRKGFKSLRDDAILKVLDGVTSIEAISRVVSLAAD
ncbi:MAG: GspE/PulE family protein [Pseudobdellovibrionaceae bacterium]